MRQLLVYSLVILSVMFIVIGLVAVGLLILIVDCVIAAW